MRHLNMESGQPLVHKKLPKYLFYQSRKGKQILLGRQNWCSFFFFFIRYLRYRASGWLRPVSRQFLVSAQVMISGSGHSAPCQALHWVWSQLKILSPSPSAPPFPTSAHTLSLSPRKKKKDSLDIIILKTLFGLLPNCFLPFNL